MKRNFICLLLAFTLLCSQALALDRAGLRAAWREISLLRSDASPYVSVPDPASFSPGELTSEKQQDALNCLNFLRSLAGLDAVELNPLYTLRAQNGALLLAANDYLDHNAPQPAGMEDALYESAYMGTSMGNIAKFNWMKPDILIDGVSYFARDDGDANLPVLGHRRWLLNPLMAQTGFGLANAESGMSYVTMYAVDMTNADARWDYVAWPCAGAFPVEMMRRDLAWSVSLNDANYDIAASRIRIQMTEKHSGAEFSFEPDRENADGYCTLSTEKYGSGSCIIFRPEIENAGISEYVQNQLWEICLTGLKTPDGKDAQIRYTCEMASLYPQDVANIELNQLEAELSVGESLQLQADVIPDYADDLSVVWGSSDPLVASVNAAGMVSAVGTGECSITAMTANGRKDICSVTVK